MNQKSKLSVIYFLSFIWILSVSSQAQCNDPDQGLISQRSSLASTEVDDLFLADDFFEFSRGLRQEFRNGKRYWVLGDGTSVEASLGFDGFQDHVYELIENKGQKYILESGIAYNKVYEGLEETVKTHAITTLISVSDSSDLTLDSEFHSGLSFAISNGILRVEGIDQVVDLERFKLIQTATYQGDVFMIEGVRGDAEEFSGTLVTRLRDSKVLRIHNQVAPSGILKLSIEDGILSIRGIYKSIDLRNFDSELRFFKNVSPANAVFDKRGEPTDVVEEVEQLYKDLVSESKKHPERFTEKADPAFMRKMAESVRGKRSLVVLGKSGVGKSSAIRAFAREVGLGHVPGLPRTLQIFQVRVANLLSGTQYTGMVERRVSTLVGAAQESGCIFSFDEVHSLAGAGTSSFRSNDITQMIKEPIELGEMVILGTDTAHEFYNAFGKDPAFLERFEKLDMAAPSSSELIDIVRARLSSETEDPLETEIIEEAIRLSSEYDLTASQPRSAVNLLLKALVKREEAGIEVPLTGEFLKASAIEKYGFDPAVFERSKVREKLHRLEHQGLNEELIGQEPAKKAIISMWRRKFTRVGDPSQVNSLLFVGPPGVGKSRLAQLSAELMDYKKTFIEMNKFQRGEVEDFRREVYSALLEHPYRIIILDEIEKAHNSVQEAALSMLQSGEFTVLEKYPGGGVVAREVNARHVLFILTSNAAGDYVESKLRAEEELEESTLRELLEADGISKAIISRIFKIVPMGRPSKEEFVKGLRFYLNRTLDRESRVQGVVFTLGNEEEFMKEMTDRYSEALDYRDIKKMMLEIEDEISKAVLESDFQPNDSVVLTWKGEGNPRKREKKWESWMSLYN